MKYTQLKYDQFDKYLFEAKSRRYDMHTAAADHVSCDRRRTARNEAIQREKID